MKKKKRRAVKWLELNSWYWWEKNDVGWWSRMQNIY